MADEASTEFIGQILAEEGDIGLPKLSAMNVQVV